MSTVSVPSELLGLAARALPKVELSQATLARGEFHDVVLIADLAAIRVTRTAEAADLLPRRVELLHRLSELGLPFAVPRPLADVVEWNGRCAVALSWIPGRPAATASPAALRDLLKALALVSPSTLGDALDVAQSYAGRTDWEALMIHQAMPLLPDRHRTRARESMEKILAAPAVTPGLVHGDLTGANLHWDESGRLLGVLDWDLACTFDPALDVACLGSFGWANVGHAVDADSYLRAKLWASIFPLEWIVSALLTPGAAVQVRVDQASRWFDEHPDAGSFERE